MHAPERERRFVATAPSSTSDRMSTAEFIGLVAAMMSLTAMAVDVMLPALPQIGEALGVADPNDRQNVVIVYMLGFSLGQPAYGRLSDRYGRKPVLFAGTGIFILGSILCGLAQSMEQLILFRAVQGLGSGAVLPSST